MVIFPKKITLIQNGILYKHFFIFVPLEKYKDIGNVSTFHQGSKSLHKYLVNRVTISLKIGVQRKSKDDEISTLSIKRYVHIYFYTVWKNENFTPI